MSGKIVQAVSRAVSERCQVQQCRKQGCSVSMEKAPAYRVIIDLDCERLGIVQTGKRCDYLFVGEEKGAVYVAPIELKSGGFGVSAVIEQLQGGADILDSWLPPGSIFRFAPVLVHGKGVHREDRNKLRKAHNVVKLRGHKAAPVLIGCGGRLSSKLRKKIVS